MEEDQITQEDSYKDLTASYDPADDKLRLRSLHRLPKELYERLTKGAGFQWAPKQQLLYAIWSPNREDLLLSLAGEIGDEDTSLVERAEQRAERFGEYKESRTDDAERAYGRFKEISSRIPLGQPILVGHHSERRARRDADKIDNAVRQAVQMWDTAKYWQSRAKGALLHAEYKERPDVRYRRIKGLETDRRREEKAKQEAELALKLWNDPDKELTLQRAKVITNSPICSVSRSFPLKDFPRDPPASQYEGPMSLWSALQDGVITPEQAREFAVKAANYRIYRAGRWLQHIENRLLYERAMLDESGGDPGERFDFAVGGRVLTRGEWRVITRINKKDGHVLSLSTSRFTVQVEDVKEYQPPTREEVETVKAATKLAPMCNYPGENFLYLTKDQWDRLAKDYRGSETLKATEQYGEHRVRRRYGVGFKQNLVFLMDAKVVEPPPPPQKPQERPVLPPVERDVLSAPTAYQAPPRTVFDDMRDQIEGRSSNESVPMTIAISEHVLTVLRRATLTDDSVVLPEQMERKLYEEVNRILERAGGRWDRSRKAHLFGEGPKRVLGRAIETGVLNTADVNIAKANFRPGVQAFVVPGLFPTPPDLARQVVRTGDVRPGQRVLEPEAGTGNLVRAVLNEFTGADCGKIVAIEINANLAEALREQKRLTLYANDDNFTVYHRDFLTVTPKEIGKFDRIVMNPPFENGQDIAHVRHAYQFLKPRGQLAAIVSEGPFFRSDRKSKDFRAWFEEIGAEDRKLDKSAFKASGSMVQTRLLTAEMPDLAPSVDELPAPVVKRIPLRKLQPVG